MAGNRKSQNRGRLVDLDALQDVQNLLGDQPRRRDLLVEYLHLLQDNFNHLSARHLTALAEEMKLSVTEVFEVATFYHHFDVIRDNEQPPPQLTVRVCDSLTCEMFNADSLIDELTNIHDQNVRIQRVPCVGRCNTAPVAVVGTNPVEHATTEKVTAAIKKLDRHATIQCEYIDYSRYCENGGYQMLHDCHSDKIDSDELISSLKSSGLRGLGGAGFPAGTKWEILKKQQGPKLVAVNIDEGEPGTFKDRYYLERDPHRFLEGMLIACWAIDAEAVYIYIRDEYTECRQILQKELGILAEKISEQLPHIELRRGAGAYICGEESAMIESIEGKRGMPRLRPPYVAEVGLFGRPTLEHNMETLYWVRDIVENGPEFFTQHGRNGRTGLRSFSVSGRVKNPGVYLAPAGISLRELIDEYCGGMQDGHTLYGYFPGGASGGILPAEKADLPLDFDTLNDTGCFIGSAAVIVLSQHDSARKLALNAMRFFAHESCGQCTPCRSGTSKAVSLMEKPDWDTDLLEELSVAMADASICGLGQAAPNPLRCAVKYFPGEFQNDS